MSFYPLVPEDDGTLPTVSSAVAFRRRQGFGGQVAKAEVAFRFSTDYYY
jgi:hypothetical protein